MIDDSGRPRSGVCAATRMRIMLALGTSFSREQVSWLVATAMRWGTEAGERSGYRRRVAEENAEYPPAPIFHHGDLIQESERAEARRAADADRTPGFPGRGMAAVLALRAEKARQDQVAEERKARGLATWGAER